MSDSAASPLFKVGATVNILMCTAVIHGWLETFSTTNTGNVVKHAVWSDSTENKLNCQRLKLGVLQWVVEFEIQFTSILLTYHLVFTTGPILAVTKPQQLSNSAAHC